MLTTLTATNGAHVFSDVIYWTLLLSPVDKHGAVRFILFGDCRYTCKHEYRFHQKKADILEVEVKIVCNFVLKLTCSPLFQPPCMS